MATANIYDLADTWNDGGTTFTAIKMDVTDTASASGSLLMDLLVDSSTLFSISAAGNISLGADVAAPGTRTLSMPSVTGVADTAGADFTIEGSQGTGTGTGGSIIFKVAPAGTSGTAQNGLERFVEFTQSRSLNVYNTYTDASNYERGFMKWNSNVLEIGTEAAGSGTGRGLSLRSATTSINLDGNGLTWNTTGKGIGMGVNLPGVYNTIQSAGNISLWHASGDAVFIRESSGFSNGARLGFLTSSNALHALLSTQNAGVLRLSGVTTGVAFELAEQTAPAAPSTDNVRIYAEDNGSGKTRLMALFPTGAAQQIAIEP